MCFYNYAHEFQEKYIKYEMEIPFRLLSEFVRSSFSLVMKGTRKYHQTQLNINITVGTITRMRKSNKTED